MIGVLGVLVAIVLIIMLAYRGWGILPASLICSLIVVITNARDIWEAFSVDYVAGFTYFAGAFVLIFVLGSIFGKVMGDCGAASAISHKLLNTFGPQQAILVLILAAAILTYGGINLFIVIFTVYPIALILLKAENLPKRFIVSCLGLGGATFTMTAIPGTPAIQNLIPAQVLGTTPTAGALIGVIASVLMFVLGFLYISRQAKKAKSLGESFVPGPQDDMDKLSLEDTTKLPNWLLSLLPLVIVIVLIITLSQYIDAIFSVSIALTIGIVLTYILNWGRLESPLKTLNEGAINSIIPLINTAAIVGFGYVVQNVNAFKSFVAFALGLPFHPLVSAAISTNIIAGITGSASGGLSIFMQTMGQEYIAAGINPEILHRISALASGGLDSLPHSGAVISVLMITGVTHREGYKDLGVVTIIVPILVLIVSILLGMLLY